MPELTPHRYTLSEAAYEGLYALLVEKPRQAYPLSPSAQAATMIAKRRPQAEFDGIGSIRTVQDGPATHHKEGVSHGLNYLSLFYQDPAKWTDARPTAIKTQHEQLAAIYKEQFLGKGSNANYYNHTPVYKSNWFIETCDEDLRNIANDDTPWDKLTDHDKQLRLSLPINRKQRYLSLSDQAKEFYITIAQFYCMAPFSTSHTTTTYIAAALEAIGLGWLAPPEGYKSLLSVVTNSHKFRPELIFNGTHHTYGNHKHEPFTVSKEQIDTILSPVVLSDEDKTTYTQEELNFYRKFPAAYADELVAAEAYLAAHPETDDSESNKPDQSEDDQ